MSSMIDLLGSLPGSALSASSRCSDSRNVYPNRRLALRNMLGFLRGSLKSSPDRISQGLNYLSQVINKVVIFVMSKHYISDTSHIPFALSILTSFNAPLQPERPADEQLLEVQQEIHLKYQSDDEDIFEEKIIEGKRVRNRKTKSSLFVENETLKKENHTLMQKGEQYRNKLQQVTATLKERVTELKHNQSALNELTQALKNSEKRKSLLQLQLSKLYSQLQSSKADIDKYEKEVANLLNLHKSKDAQLIELMHRHSQQIKEQKATHKLQIQEYEAKQEQTRKLLKKLNGINQQKEEKLRQEVEQFKQSYEKISEISVEQGKTIKKLQQQNSILQQYIKTNTSKYEADLINVKNESDKLINQLNHSKEFEINRLLHDFKSDSEAKTKQISRLEQTIRSQEAKWMTIVQEKQRTSKELNEKLNEKQRQYEKVVMLKDKDIDKLTDEIEKKIHTIEELEMANEELFSKNQTLQNSIKEVYSQTTQLESKLLETSKQKTSFANQNSNLRSQIRQLRQQVLSLESRLSIREAEASKNESELKQLKITTEKQEDELRYYEKNLKILEAQYQQLTEIHEEQKNANSQLKQMLLQKQINFEGVKEKYHKLQQFVENYKVDTDKIRESTEKKWYELRSVYEKQLEQLQRKLMDSERSYNALKLRLEVVDRENKIYEFENTVSPNIGANANIYYKN